VSHYKRPDNRNTTSEYPQFFIHNQCQPRSPCLNMAQGSPIARISTNERPHRGSGRSQKGVSKMRLGPCWSAPAASKDWNVKLSVVQPRRLPRMVIARTSLPPLPGPIKQTENLCPLEDRSATVTQSMWCAARYISSGPAGKLAKNAARDQISPQLPSFAGAVPYHQTLHLTIVLLHYYQTRTNAPSREQRIPSPTRIPRGHRGPVN